MTARQRLWDDGWGPDAADLRPDKPERTDDNACPECERGVVIETGPQCRETGHVPLGCTDCRWTA